MRIPIEKQRHILRQITQTRLSNRHIGKLLQVSPTTVGEIRTRFTQSNQTWESIATLTDREFAEQLGTTYRSIGSGKAAPDWSAIHLDMQTRDMTLSLLHSEYLEKLADQPQLALCYSHFTDGYRKWRQSQRISMRQFHLPGDKLFIDFCGRTMPVLDQATGQEIKMQIFVAVLGASGYAFVYAVPTQKIAHWLECHTKAFVFFGGVPRQLVPDNLKAAVMKNSREELILNRCYTELAEHYQCVLNPARPRKPKDKSLAEVTVQITQRWVLAPLRHRTFFSQEELNAAITERVTWMNAKTSKKYPMSRLERFEKLDKPALMALPSEPYEHSKWRYSVRVPADYHVEFEHSHYSVPYQYLQQLVDLRATNSTLEVLMVGQRIASHVLRKTPGNSTQEGHMPVAHQHQKHNEPEQLMAWAATVGKDVDEWVRRNLKHRRDFANGVKSARKLRQLAREIQNSERLNSACAFALRFDHLGFTQLKTIIDRNTDRQPKPDMAAWVKTHANIRGAGYYRAQNNGGSAC